MNIYDGVFLSRSLVQNKVFKSEFGQSSGFKGNPYFLATENKRLEQSEVKFWCRNILDGNNLCPGNTLICPGQSILLLGADPKGGVRGVRPPYFGRKQ